MSDQKGQQPSDHVDFENIELHSDVDIHSHRNKKQEPPKSRKVKKPKPIAKDADQDQDDQPAASGGGAAKAISFLLAILFLASAGAAGYFYTQLQELQILHETLQTSHRELNEQIATATENLSDTSGSLEDAQKRIGLMSTSLKQREEDLNAAEKKSQELATKLANTENAKQKVEQDLKQAQSSLSTTRNQLKDMTSSRDKLQAELTATQQTAQQTEQALNTRINGLEADMAAQQQTYQQELQGFQQRIDRVNSDLDKAKIDLERAQRDMQAESDASRKILQEAEAAKARSATLSVEVERLRTELANAKNQIVDQQAVKTGDLIAEIDAIQQPTVRYKEPLVDARLPRGKQVAVRVLVTEVGSVEKAMLVPGQNLEPTTQQALLRNIYQWKFTPPSYEGRMIKAWHVVMMGGE